MTPFVDGVWLASDPVRIVGTRLTATMALLRLGDGSLLAYSPVSLTAERRAAVDALGRVAHVYAPSNFHHRWAGEWAAAYPGARVHAPAGLTKKLRVHRVLGDGSEPAFAGVVDETHIDGFRLDETVLVHHPSRTLVVADLVHNVGRPDGGGQMVPGVAGVVQAEARAAELRQQLWVGGDDAARAGRIGRIRGARQVHRLLREG